MAVTKSPPKRAPSKAAAGRRPKTDLSKLMAHGVEVLVFGARRRRERTRRREGRNGPSDGSFEALQQTPALLNGAEAPTPEEADGGAQNEILPGSDCAQQKIAARSPKEIEGRMRAISTDLDDSSRDSGEGSTSDGSSSKSRRDGRPGSPRERPAPRQSPRSSDAGDDVADVIQAIAEPSEANWTAAEAAVRAAATRKAAAAERRAVIVQPAAAEERRATAARMRAPMPESPLGAPEPPASAEQVYADAMANRPPRSGRHNTPAVVSKQQPLPYRCGSRLPEPPPLGWKWEACCLIHQSWYNPRADFIRKFGLSNFKSGDKAVRQNWYDCCRLCGEAGARRHGYPDTYHHPGGTMFDFQFCDKGCRNEFFLRLDATQVRTAVAVRDSGRCFKCRNRAGWRMGRVRSVAEGGGCCGLENWRTLCEVCFRTW